MDRAAETLPDRAPHIGDLVEARSRRWLLEAVEEPPRQSARVSVYCVDDDSPDQTPEVYREVEISRSLLNGKVGVSPPKGFGPPWHFSAFAASALRQSMIKPPELTVCGLGGLQSSLRSLG